MSFVIAGEVDKTNIGNGEYHIEYTKPVIIEKTEKTKQVVTLFGYKLYDKDVLSKTSEVKMLRLTKDKQIIIPIDLAEDVINNKCKIFEGKFRIK